MRLIRILGEIQMTMSSNSLGLGVVVWLTNIWLLLLWRFAASSVPPDPDAPFLPVEKITAGTPGLEVSEELATEQLEVVTLAVEHTSKLGASEEKYVLIPFVVVKVLLFHQVTA